MTDEITFTNRERDIIDRTDAELRLITPKPEGVATGFPYADHHRAARYTLREAAGPRAPSRHRQIAAWLLAWARESGDVRLYVYRPFLHWMDANGLPTDHPSWQVARDAMASAVPFEEYVAGRVNKAWSDRFVHQASDT